MFIPNPLLDLHERAEAEFQNYDAVRIVSTFGEPEAEYAAIRKGTALIDQPQRGVLELTGADRLPFLNNLLTNQIQDRESKTALAEGAGVYAFLLERNGRILADMNVLERGDRTLLETDARLIGTVRAALEKYLFAERVKLNDRVGSLHELSLHGPGSIEFLRQAGIDAGALQSLGSMRAKLFEAEVIVWRDDPAGVPGLHLLIDVNAAARVWEGLLSLSTSLSEHGRRALRPAGWAAFNAARIEAGRSLFGIDFDGSTLPHETGQLARAVSFTKGCYPGQEVVARMQARGQFARQSVGIRMNDDALPIAGTAVYDEADNPIGGVTSSTVSPVLSNAAICLAMLKRQFTAIGTVVKIPAEGAMRTGTVVKTPFL